jgi:hypothetical protein
MDASTYAFTDPREATTYTMLRHVLQNYRTTHAVSLLAGLTATVLLLAGTCVQLCEAGGVEASTLVQQTLAGLKQQVRTRQARAPLFSLAETDDADPDDPRVRDQTEALSRALATLIGDAEEAGYISGEGSWRIACALVVDLLGLWLPPGELPGGGQWTRCWTNWAAWWRPKSPAPAAGAPRPRPGAPAQGVVRRSRRTFPPHLAATGTAHARCVAEGRGHQLTEAGAPGRTAARGGA